MFGLKSPAEYGVEAVGDYLKDHFADLLSSYISVLPILVGVSVGVYALLQMISGRLANAGVIGVFVYGALVVIA